MFKRIGESHQGSTFSDMESAVQYARAAEKSMTRYRAFFKEISQLGIKGRYLEIGAGPGILAATIARDNPGVQITGVDLSPDMVSIAGEYIRNKGLQDRIQFVLGDAEDEDFINTLGRFDLIYSTYTLHHWKEPGKAIRNLTCAFADTGVLYLYDLRRVWWLYWIPVRNGFFNSIRAAYIAEEIHGMFQELGIDKYEIKKVFPFMHSIIVR